MTLTKDDLTAINQLMLQAVQPLQNDMKEMQSDISELREDVTNMKGDISELREDVTNMKGDISELREDVTNMKGDISELQNDVSGVKGDVSDLRGTVAGIQLHLENVTDKNIAILAENHGYLIDKLNQAIPAANKNLVNEVKVNYLVEEVEKLKQDVAFLKCKIA
ncbi:MAG TPA: DUF1515 family protein [Candidatus Blautia excrementipullorum]|nr:DUF1515 family protein [Candidatus Blautia excrementipullorum]